MKMSRRLNLTAALLLGLSTAATAYAQEMKPEDSIKARKAVLRVIALNFGPLGAMAKGDIPFDAKVFQVNSARMASVSSMPMLSYFPEGTDKETEGMDTKALPEIWLDWDKFKQKMETMQQEVATLAKVAGSGDEGAMKKQVGETGKSCKSCHDDFRSK